MPSESSYELVTKVAEAFEKKGGQIILDARVEKLNKDKAGKLVSLTAEGKHQTINVNFKSLNKLLVVGVHVIIRLIRLIFHIMVQ